MDLLVNSLLDIDKTNTDHISLIQIQSLPGSMTNACSLLPMYTLLSEQSLLDTMTDLESLLTKYKQVQLSHVTDFGFLLFMYSLLSEQSLVCLLG